MRTEACRIHGRDRVMVGEMELPPIGPGELLLRVVSSSMCLSTYKALCLGEEHKRVPSDISEVPVMTGHEFAGVLEEVGESLSGQFSPGQSVAILPTMSLPNGYSPGYSYPYYGGDATYCIVPEIAVEKGCVLPYEGGYYANASLAEPMSCIIGAFHASYHTEPLVWKHDMGIRPEGSLALLGCGGAMGIGALDYALHGPYASKVVVAVDVNEERLSRGEGRGIAGGRRSGGGGAGRARGHRPTREHLRLLRHRQRLHDGRAPDRRQGGPLRGGDEDPVRRARAGRSPGREQPRPGRPDRPPPTLCELAGASTEGLDGRSLVPLLGGTVPDTWRKHLFVEHYPGHRFRMMRSDRHVYVEYPGTNERELYDMFNDPNQLRSVHRAPDKQALMSDYSDRLARFAVCSDEACRAAEV